MKDADPTITVDGVLLRDCWYYALPSSAVRGQRIRHVSLLGEPVLIGRDRAGAVFAIKDTCPHRGTLLSRGRFDGDTVECPYHGWRFATDGRCVAIPSQLPDQKPQAGDIRATAYPVREANGNIWVFIGTPPTDGALPPLPELPAGAATPRLHIAMTFACNVDLAVTGLMDPAHGAFVHASSLWRGHGAVKEKAKAFSPAPFGWRMDRHTASSNSRAYRLFLGGAPDTEITYSLPGVRIEHAETPKAWYAGLTACTPVDDTTTVVHHVMYWDAPGGALLTPLVKLVGWRFLDQDRRAVIAMQDGLAFDPPTMLIQDADTQTRWYRRLKREWLASKAEGRAFENPIEPCTLRWRS